MFFNEFPVPVQLFDKKRISVLDKKTCKFFCFRRQRSVFQDQLYKWQLESTAYTRVVFTECRSDMYNPGTVIHCDIIICTNAESDKFAFLNGLCSIREKRFVFHTDHLGSGLPCKNRKILK